MVEALKELVDLNSYLATGVRPDRAKASDAVDAELLDEALARVARLEAALAITGGTVHDVNNLLTVLSGNLYMLTELVRDRSSLYEKVRAARNSADKCGALMRELLTFSRGTDDQDQTICPSNHVKALEPLLRRGVPAEYGVEICNDCEPWSVVSTAAQFESAVTNLVFNARDALSGNGTIQVQVDNATVDVKLAERLRVATGDYVCVRVVDDGTGIPADILPRIVEPLFTTKQSGSGTGLGLNMVQRYVNQYHGALSIDSVEGQGTQVQIWLPRSDDQAAVTANMTLPLSTLTGGDETALLLSTDESVRSAIEDILQALGYTVILAAMGKPVSQDWQADSTPSILVCERSLANQRMERRWIDSLRKSKQNLRHVAVLAPDANIADTAPDADAHIFRPIAVIDLARAMRAAVEN
jgi:signal transduction histidine kinase